MYNSDMFARTKRHEEEARDLAFFTVGKVPLLQHCWKEHPLTKIVNETLTFA